MSASAKQPRRRGRGQRWLIMVLGGVAAAAATPSAALVAILLAPALTLWLSDDDDDKSAARPVLFAGLAATVPQLVNLWAAGHTMPLALAQASDVIVLATAWGAQAAGWLVSECAPLVIAWVMVMRAQARAAQLRALRRRLEEEWNLPSGEAK